jgi:hypothetical protein
MDVGLPTWWWDKFVELKNAVNQMDQRGDHMDAFDRLLLIDDIINIAQYLQVTCMRRAQASVPPPTGPDA